MIMAESSRNQANEGLFSISQKPTLMKKYYEMDSYIQNKRYAYKWCIENFSYVDDTPGYELSSHEFGAPQVAMWKLEISMNKTEESIARDIGVNLIATQMTNPKNVEFRLCFKGKNGREYFSTLNTATFNKANEKVESSLIVSREALLSNKEILEDDVLTVYCELVVPQIPVHGVARPVDEKQANYNLSEIVNTTCLGENLGKIYKNGKFCDFMLKTSEKKFPVHKAVLAAHSSIFNDMFEDKELREAEIADKLAEPVLEEFLEFLYTGELENVTVHKAIRLLHLAFKYHVKALKNTCVEFLCNQITCHNFYDIAVMAHKHKEPNLKAAVQRIFAHECGQILRDIEWENFVQKKPEIATELKKFYVMEHLRQDIF